MEEQCAICHNNLEGGSFSDKCKCDNCNVIIHTQCAKMRKLFKCIKCKTHLPIPGSSQSRAPSIKSNRSSNSSHRSKLQLDIEHLRKEEELFMQQQQEKQWLLEDKHKRQESFLKRKFELERQLTIESYPEEHESSHEAENEVVRSIAKVNQWQSQNIAHKSAQGDGSVYQSVEQGPILHTQTRGMPKNPSYHIHEKCSTCTGNNLSKDRWSARQVIKLDLPVFDGNPEDWPSFYSTFRSTTSLCDIQEAENVRRLDKALRGSARKAVSGLLLFPDKVELIIERLKLLFGRTDLIINSQIEKLRNDHRPITVDSIESIIEYATKVENIASLMVQADLNYHLWNPALLQELVDKLPTLIKLQWAEFRSQQNSVNIETFSTWLFDKAMKASYVLNKPLKFESPKKRTRASTYVHSEVEQNKSCICENNDHQLFECQLFLSMNRKERWNAVNANGRCSQCLKSHNGRCFSNKICGINNCSFKHHPLLHKYEDTTQENVQEAHVNHHSGSTVSTLFKIIPVTLHSGNESVETFAMLDDGSSLSLMEHNLAKSLKINGTPETLCLKWTGNTTKVEESIRTTIEISSPFISKRFVMKNVRTVSSLELPVQTILGNEIKMQFSNRCELEVPSYKNAQPQILIGLDNPTLLVNSQARFSASGDLVAAKTKLGWTVFGANSTTSRQVYHICECNSLSKAFKEFIALDHLGTSVQTEKLLSDSDYRANRLLENLSIYSNGRYEVPLLWKYDSIRLPSSLNMAKRRLNCLLNKFKKDPELKAIMHAQILDYINKGYARTLTDEEVNATSHLPNWYLPTFVVRNPNKPSKIRIVWDAAAKVGNISLNDLLLKGPDLLSNLPGVLFRFRQWAVAITGDIREMFHQIKVRQEDQRFQRFLWEMEEGSEPKTLTMQVMTFGASCSPCCAQFIKNKNAEKYKDKFPRAYEAITRNHYVDDLLDSVPTEEMALSLANDVREIHASAGFEIRNWRSNSTNVYTSLETSGSSDSLDLSLCSELPLEKILGMFWNTTKDCFTYSLKFNKSNHIILNGSKIPTKREMLRLVMSIYDPLGFLSHFLIYPKVLLQEVWRRKSLWDEMISEDLVDKWLLWIGQLSTLQQVEIPRHYFITTSNCVPDIHIFVDASEQAYAAVAYLRLQCEDEVKCSIITAKSRVSPLKPLTIPRLELLAALLGTRLESHIREEHSVSFRRTYFWSDSRTVLSWIKSDMRNFKPYVACRISEILEHSQEDQWNWVPTDKNIADESTRMKLVDTSSSSEWFNGPSFLYKPECDWPKSEDIPDTREEIRSSTKDAVSIFYIEVIDSTRFSNWNRMLKTQAWVLRFINNIKSSKPQRTFEQILSSAELAKAENYIFKLAQASEYQDEIHLLRMGKKVVNKKSAIYKKLPFLDENGVLRSKGRLDKLVCADIDLKDNIILPRKHPVTQLLINHYHVKFHHHNHETVVNELKQRFSIPSLRAECKFVRKSCQKCKNNAAKPSDPQMAELPRARLQPFTAPFSFTGIDFFGPVSVSINRKVAKRWGVIFTCLNVRAVHIEVAHSLTTDSCIIALRNFMNRRGVPIEIHSDNGTNFKGAIVN